MKYMTFPASCSFCCIANMLEHFGVDATDSEIVVGAELPYRFRYDGEDDCFSTGIMLQQPEDYNRFLKKYGLYFVNYIITREEALRFLVNYAPCMIGLTTDFGKHAMLFIEKTAEGYCFLNPHRENDGQADWLVLAENEVLERLSDSNHIGYLKQGNINVQVDIDNTENILNDYQLRFTAFCQTKQTATDIAAWRDKLLRPIALDMPVMMSLVGETGLAEKLSVLQNQIFLILRMEECIPCDNIDLKLFDEVIAEYTLLVKKRC